MVVFFSMRIESSNILDNFILGLMESLHEAAFRGGLEKSLYCPENKIGWHTPDMVTLQPCLAFWRFIIITAVLVNGCAIGFSSFTSYHYLWMLIDSFKLSCTRKCL